jgi:hypothetical protein
MRTARFATICRIGFADWRMGCSVISATCPLLPHAVCFPPIAFQVAKSGFQSPSAGATAGLRGQSSPARR